MNKKQRDEMDKATAKLLGLGSMVTRRIAKAYLKRRAEYQLDLYNCDFCGNQIDYLESTGYRKICGFPSRPSRYGFACRSCLLGLPGQLHSDRFGLR
jgi:hypothetical protein